MKIAYLDLARQLRSQLATAESTLQAFEAHEGDTCLAYCTTFSKADGREFSTLLLPVPKADAVAAARRSVAEIVEQLARIGVEMPGAAPALPVDTRFTLPACVGEG